MAGAAEFGVCPFAEGKGFADAGFCAVGAGWGWDAAELSWLRGAGKAEAAGAEDDKPGRSGLRLVEVRLNKPNPTMAANLILTLKAVKLFESYA